MIRRSKSLFKRHAIFLNYHFTNITCKRTSGFNVMQIHWSSHICERPVLSTKIWSNICQTKPTKSVIYKVFLSLFRLRGEPVIHLGPVAAGRQVALDDQLRQEFSRRHGIVAFDTELDAVVESIYGNRKDQVRWIHKALFSFVLP